MGKIVVVGTAGKRFQFSLQWKALWDVSDLRNCFPPREKKEAWAQKGQ